MGATVTVAGYWLPTTRLTKNAGATTYARATRPLVARTNPSARKSGRSVGSPCACSRGEHAAHREPEESERDAEQETRARVNDEAAPRPAEACEALQQTERECERAGEEQADAQEAHRNQRQREAAGDRSGERDH